MKRTIMIVLAVAASFAMTGCDALDSILQTNIFAPFYEVSADGVESAKSDPVALLELAQSDTFFETLSDPANADLKGTVLTTIDTTLATATEPAIIQDLTLLGAEIELKTVGGDDVVNNVAAVLVDQSAILNASGELDPAKLLTAIMPDSVVDSSGTITDPDAFKAIIEGFVAADVYYKTLGTNLAGATYVDTTVNAGAVAQSALVSAMVASLTPPLGTTSGDYLLGLVEGTVVAPTDFAFPDISGGSSLGNLFTAAGIDPATLPF